MRDYIYRSYRNEKPASPTSPALRQTKRYSIKLSLFRGTIFGDPITLTVESHKEIEYWEQLLNEFDTLTIHHPHMEKALTSEVQLVQGVRRIVAGNEDVTYMSTDEQFFELVDSMSPSNRRIAESPG